MLLLKTWLCSIPDHRRAQGKVSDLSPLLLFSILAVLSGAPSYRKSQRFIHARRPSLHGLGGLSWKRAPAHPSIRYPLPGLPVEAVERACRQHPAHLASALPEVQQIAVDGKTLRGSFDRFEDQKAVQLFSALATDTPLVLGHVLLSDQTANTRHEIPAAQQLRQDLNLTGHLFTLEALHAPKNGCNDRPD